jgi:hypothetical protein
MTIPLGGNQGLKDVAGLEPFDVGHFTDQIGIPSRSQPIGLGKDGGGHLPFRRPIGGSALGEAVQALDVAARLNAKPGDARIRIQAVDLLLEGHSREEIVDARLGWQPWVL